MELGGEGATSKSRLKRVKDTRGGEEQSSASGAFVNKQRLVLPLQGQRRGGPSKGIQIAFKGKSAVQCDPARQVCRARKGLCRCGRVQLTKKLCEKVEERRKGGRGKRSFLYSWQRSCLATLPLLIP